MLTKVWETAGKGKENRGRRDEQAKTHRASMFLAKNFIDSKQRL